MRMKTLATLSTLLIALSAGAQSYCTPFFANGCFNWRTFEVQAGPMLWTPGTDDCWTAIYTGMPIPVEAGTELPMSVTNGVWCGCAVWVDLDQSLSFEPEENLYFAYVGGAPSYQYNFSIAIPAGTPAGAYRMRVVSPWGSDGFLTNNGNGNGPCGSYQYGDFKDFTLDVGGTTSVQTPTLNPMSISPNPTDGAFSLDGLAAGELVQVLDASGRLVHAELAQAPRLTMDAAAWQAGLYAVRITGPQGVRAHRLLVR